MAFHKFIRAALEGSPIDLYGDGSQTRDFTFVDDVVDGLVAAPAASPGSVFNLGGGSRVSLAQAIETLESVVGRPVHIRRLTTQAGDVTDTLASIDAARQAIGYAPKVSIREGLERELAWLRRVGLAA